MKKSFIYKRWSFLVLWNKLVFAGYLSFKRKVFFVQFDTNRFLLWRYIKKIKTINITKVLKDNIFK